MLKNIHIQGKSYFSYPLSSIEIMFIEPYAFLFLSNLDVFGRYTYVGYSDTSQKELFGNKENRVHPIYVKNVYF